MPNFDKTGPNGEGPQTGRGRGINRLQQYLKKGFGKGFGKVQGLKQGKSRGQR